MPGRLGDEILYGGAQYVCVLSMEFASCPFFSMPRILRWRLYFGEIYVLLHLAYTGEREIPVKLNKKGVALCWNRASLALRTFQVANANAAK